MITVYKYSIETIDYQEVQLPKGAEILTVQTQNNKPCIWAKVDTDADLESRYFEVHGTGNPIESDSTMLIYIGTYQLSSGMLVFHLFERI